MGDDGARLGGSLGVHCVGFVWVVVFNCSVLMERDALKIER